MNERRVLESWKAIASYLGRTEKTCRKWEHELGLPVHRLDKSAKAHVFAYADELDRWKEEKLKAAKTRGFGLLSRIVWLSRGSHKARFWTVVISGLVFLMIAGLLVRQITQRSPSPGAAQAVKGVAILPFTDLSPNKEYGYLCDGMVETLIDALNKIEGLRVPARTSAFYFKGKDVPLSEIGKKLNVDYVLEASVQVEGERMRVIPRLLSVADGYQIWSEKYDRGREDIFAIEDEIAHGIVENLKVKILGETQEPLVKPGTANREAYDLYLRGRYLWGKRGRDNLMKAVDYFQKAIDLDPDNAPSYAGLASTYNVLANNGIMAPHEAFPKARAYAVKALEIDDTIADAHRALGGVKDSYEWDFAGAEREFRKALELDPRDPYTRQSLATYWAIRGKHDEAIKEIMLARDLDPLALRIRANVGLFLYFARKYGEAERVLKKEIEFAPEDPAVYSNLASVYIVTGRFEETLEYAMKSCERAVGGRPEFHAHAEFAIGFWPALQAGSLDKARKILDAYVERCGTEKIYMPSSSWAQCYGMVDDKDKAFGFLEKAYEEKDRWMKFLRVDPVYDSLRDDPRFTDLLRRIGLEK